MVVELFIVLSVVNKNNKADDPDLCGHAQKNTTKTSFELVMA
jgi:hypothetical protein